MHCNQRQTIPRDGKRQSIKRQQGVVIVVALFIVALVATMAYIMMSRLERDTRRTSMILRNTQAEFYAQGSIAWAMDQLRTNVERKKPNKLVDETPIKSPEIDVNGYKIASTIYDVQSRFNINNITTSEVQNDFKRLLLAVAPNLTEKEAQGIVLAVADWIMPTSQQPELAKYYAELPAPYRPAHRAMMMVSELANVKGITPALFNSLRPYVFALPVRTALTMREVQMPVLMTLSPNITKEMAKTIIQQRNQNPAQMAVPNAFFNSEALRGLQISTDKVAAESNYFLVETDVTIENQHVVLYTLIERASKDNKASLTLLWQSKGI